MKKNMNKNMKKKKRNASASSIQISPNVRKYRSLSDSYKKCPTFSSFIAFLVYSIELKTNLSEAMEELDLLINLEDDQFYAGSISDYYWPSKAGLIDLCNIIWKMLGSIVPDEFLATDNSIVGRIDYSFLASKLSQIEENSADEAIAPSPSILSEELMLLGREAVSAWEESEKAAFDFHESYKGSGLEYIPFSFVVSPEGNKKEQDIRECLLDFNSYISKYFVDLEEVDIPNLGLRKKRINLSEKTKENLLRIIAIILFSRILRSEEGRTVSLKSNEILSHRLKNVNGNDGFSNIESNLEYSVIISNLVFMSGILGAQSVECGVLAENELRAEYFSRLGLKHLEEACLVLLPKAAIAQVLRGFYGAGNREYLDIRELMHAVSYGRREYKSKQISCLLDKLFSNMEEKEKNEFVGFCKNNVDQWIIPLCIVKEVANALGDNYYFGWDLGIGTSISKLFENIEAPQKDECKLDKKTLEDKDYHGPDPLSVDLSPPMFISKFSGMYTWREFEDSEWVNFATALEREGFIRYSCALVSLFVLWASFRKMYAGGRGITNIRELMPLIKNLSSNRSFEMISYSLEEYLSVEPVEPACRGSLLEYVTKRVDRDETADQISLIKTFKYWKDQLIKSYPVGNISKEALDYLTKGYALTKEKRFTCYSMSVEAGMNVAFAIEAEIKSRSELIDDDVCLELKYLGVEVHSIARVPNLTLGSAIRVIDVSQKLSPRAKDKVRYLLAIATHASFSDFRRKINEVIRIRNQLSHADNIEGGKERIVANLMQLVFEDETILLVLNQTARK